MQKNSCSPKPNRARRRVGLHQPAESNAVLRKEMPGTDGFLTPDSRLPAFLRSPLGKPFGQNHQSEDLRPLRNDVADDLSPFALGIHTCEKQNPNHASDYQED